MFSFIFGCAGSPLLSRPFSSCGRRGLLPSSGAQASPHGGPSCRSAQALGLGDCRSWGCRPLERRLNSRAAQASLLRGIRIFPNPCLLLREVNSLPLATREALERIYLTCTLVV